MDSNAPHSEVQVHGASGDRAIPLYCPALCVLYASLISVYLILRFAGIGDQWPTPQAVRLEAWLAAIATLTLIVSSVALVLAQRAERSSRVQIAQRWLLLTFFLGIGFAIFQASEYRRRWSHGLIPAPFSNSLHDRADLHYLSAVHQRLTQLATAINKSKVRQNQLVEQLQNLPDEPRGEHPRLEAELKRLQADEPQRWQRLAIVNRVLINEAKWTSLIVATSDDVAIQRRAIAALAYDIQPHRAFAAHHQQFRQSEALRLEESVATAKEALFAAETSVKENGEPIKELLDEVAKVTAEQQNLQTQLKSHLRQLLADEELDDAPEPSNDPKRVALDGQLAEVQQRLEERHTKLTAAAKRMTDAEDSVSQHSLELSSIAARQAIIAELDREQGLNRQHDWLHLPVCIPGGTAWAWSYFALTSLHFSQLAHLLIAVSAIVTQSPKLNRGGLPQIEQIAPNWHSMVIVWVILFVLLYLI